MAENFEELYSNLTSDERFKSLFPTQDEFEKALQSNPSMDTDLEQLFGVKSASEYLKKKDQPIIQNLGEENSFSLSPLGGQTEEIPQETQPVPQQPQEVVEQPQQGVQKDLGNIEDPYGLQALGLPPLGYGKSFEDGPQPDPSQNWRLSLESQIKTAREKNDLGSLSYLLGEINKNLQFSNDFRTYYKQGKFKGQLEQINGIVAELYEKNPSAFTDKGFVNNLNKLGLVNPVETNPSVIQKYKQENNITFLPKQKGAPYIQKPLDQRLKEINTPAPFNDFEKGLVQYLTAYDQQRNPFGYDFAQLTGTNQDPLYEMGSETKAEALTIEEQKFDKLIQGNINSAMKNAMVNLPANFFDNPAIITSKKEVIDSKTGATRIVEDTEVNPNRKLSFDYGLYMIDDAGNPKVNPVYLSEYTDRMLNQPGGLITPRVLDAFNAQRKQFNLDPYTREDVAKIIKPRYERLAKIAAEQQLESTIVEKRLSDINLFKEEVERVDRNLESDIFNLSKNTQKLINDRKVELLENSKSEIDRSLESTKKLNESLYQNYLVVAQNAASPELKQAAYQNYLSEINANATAYEEKVAAIKKQVEVDFNNYALEIENDSKGELELINKKYGIISDKDEKGKLTTAAYRKYRDAYVKEYNNYKAEERINSNTMGWRLTDIVQSSSARVFGNAIQTLNAAIGYENNPVGDLMKYLDYVQTKSEVYIKPYSQVLETDGFFSVESLKSAVQNTIQQAPNLALGVATTSLSGNPYIGGGIMWGYETIDQTGQTYRDVFARTGSILQAENSAAKTLQTQILLGPLYTVSMLPFTKGFLSKIASGGNLWGFTKKFATGLALEASEEIPVEWVQGYNDYSNSVDNPEPFSVWFSKNGGNTAIDVLPSIAVLGGGSAAMETYSERMTEQAKSRVLATLGRLGMSQVVSDAIQIIGEGGINILPEYLYRTQQIDAQELMDMKRAFGEVVKALPEAKELVSDKDHQKYFVSLATQKAQKQKQMEESKDEAQKKRLEAVIADIDKKMTDVATGKPLKITKITFKDGGSVVLGNDAMAANLKNSQFLESVSDGSITVETQDTEISRIIEDKKKQMETELQEATDKGAKNIVAAETGAREVGATLNDGEKLTLIAQNATNNGQKNTDRILNEATVLQRVLNQTAPGANIVFMNDAEYQATMDKINGKASSAGNFAFDKNDDGSYSIEIQINLDKANDTTTAHEVGHAILLATLGMDPELFNEMRIQLKRVVETNIGNQALANIDALVEKYASLEKGEEFLVELAATLKQNEKNLEIGTLEKIAKVISDFVARVTGGKIQLFDKISSRVDFTNFVNGMVETLRTGELSQTLKDKRNAVQEQTAGQVPVQSETGTSQEVEEGKPQTESQVTTQEETVPTETLEEAGQMNNGTQPFIPSPIEIDIDFLSKAQLGDKINIPSEQLLGGKQVDVIAELRKFKEATGRNPRVWFWMADQLKRGMYVNPKSGVTHFLEGGFNYSNDPKNIENEEIWATGLDEKLLNSRLPFTDFIWLMAGSPTTSFNFSKGTSKVLIKEIEAALKNNVGKRIDGILINDGTFEEFTKIAEKMLPNNIKKWDAFLNAIKNPNMIETSARKTFAETILHEGGDKKITLPFQQFVHQELGIPTLQEFLPLVREQFLVENNFRNGDMGILLKPNGKVNFNSGSHDTYGNSILGEVVGFPNRKINIKEVLPKEALQVVSKETKMPLEKPSEPAIIKTAVGDLGKIYEGDKLKSFESKAQETATERDFILPFGKYKGQWFTTTPPVYRDWLISQPWFDPRKYLKPRTEEMKSKSQLDFTQIAPEYNAALQQNNGDKVATFTTLIEKGYTPKRIKEAIGIFDFDENAFKQAQANIAVRTLDTIGTTFTNRQEAIKQEINNNLGNIEAIHEDLIAQGYSNLEIFTAARDMDFLSTQDLIDIFGAQYRQTVQKALQDAEYPADFLDELEADARTLKVSQRASEIADVVREAGIGIVDSAVAIDSLLDYLKENGFDQIAIALTNAVKQFAKDRGLVEKGINLFDAVRSGQMGDKLYTPEAINYAFSVSSELFSQAGRILQLARYFNETNQMALIEKQLNQSGVVLTESQKKTLEALVNDYQAAQKDNKEKLKALEEDWSDQAYEAFNKSEKAVGIATIKVAQFLDARKPIFWNDRITSGTARALLGVTTTILSFVSNIENNIWSTNIAARAIQKFRDVFGSGIRGNTLSMNNWLLARKLTSKRMWFDMNTNAAYGVMNTGATLNKYYDNLAQVNFFKDAIWASKFMGTMVKKVYNKDFNSMTPEEQADAYDMTLVKLRDGKIELRDGKTYTFARSLAWTLGTGPVLAATTGNVSFLKNTGGPLITEGVGRIMSYGGDIAFGYMAAQRAMIDYFQNIQGTRYQDGIFNDMITNANGKLDEKSLRALSEVLRADAELYSRFEKEGLKRTLLGDNIISGGISLVRGSLRKNIRSLYVENRKEMSGSGLVAEARRELLSARGLAKTSLQVLDVGLFTLMPFTKVPVNFLGSAIAKVVPIISGPKYIMSEGIYQYKNNKFNEKYPIGKKLTSENQRREYEKAKIDLFSAKRQATYDVAQFATSLAIYSFAMSAVQAGAILITGGDDQEKEKALKQFGLRGGLYNATLHYEYLAKKAKNTAQDFGGLFGQKWFEKQNTDYFLARRGGFAKQGDVILNTQNAGFVGYAMGLYGSIDAGQKKQQADNTMNLFDTQRSALTTLVSTSISSGIENLPMFQGLARIGDVLSDFKKEETAKTAWTNFISGNLSTSMSVFFPSFFSFMSKGNAELVQTASDISVRTENPSWPIVFNEITLRVVQKLNRNVSFENTRTEFYDAKIGPFGEDLSYKVTVAEPGTAGAFVQAMFDPFSVRTFAVPAREHEKEIQRYRDSLDLFGSMINLALIYEQMTGRSFEWKRDGKTSSFFDIITNPMSNKFDYTDTIFVGGGADAANILKNFKYELPNDLYRQELKIRGEYFRGAMNKYAAMFKDVLSQVKTSVELGEIEQAKVKLVDIFEAYQKAQSKTQIDYMNEYKMQREKDYLRKLRDRNLLTQEEIQAYKTAGLMTEDGLIQ